MKLNKKIPNAITAIVCFAPLIIIPFAIDYFYYPKILFVYITLAYMAISWLLNRLSTEGRTDLVKATSTGDKIIGIYFILITISTLLSPNLKTSLWGTRLREEGLFAISAYILLYLFSKQYYRKSNKHIYLFLISVSLVALYGISQYFGFDPIPRDFIRYNWRGRAFSTIGNPNYLGAYLVLALPIGMFSYIHSKRKITLFITLLVYLCLLCTNSRGSWIGFIFSGVPLVYYANRFGYSKKALLVTIGCMAAVTILFNLFNNSHFLSRFLSIFIDMSKFITRAPDIDRAGSSRIFIWTRVIPLIKENPVWGVGLENLGSAFSVKYESEILNYFGRAVTVDKAHNEYLHIAVSTGIPSLIVYLAFLASVVWKGFKQIKKNHYILPLFCSVLGYLSQAFFSISVVSVAPIFWIFLGILSNFTDETKKLPASNTIDWK
jgi:O-antigen ligase